MQVYPAELADVNTCYQIDTTYTTDYVWQMQTRETQRGVDIYFNTVRLPRTMKVAYPRSPDELLAHWQRTGCFLVARNLRDEVIGYLDAYPQPWQNQLWIYNLVVVPHYRRQGVSSLLLDAANRWAIDQELGQLMLEMQTKNYPAIAFAQKHSFEFCGYNERYYPSGDIALFFSRSTFA